MIDKSVLKGFRAKLIGIFLDYCRVMQISSLVLLCYLAWIKTTYVGEFFFLLSVFANATANRLIGYKHGLEDKNDDD